MASPSPGCRVKVVKNKATMKCELFQPGQQGKVLSVDEESGNCSVQFDGGDVVNVCTRHLKVVAEVSGASDTSTPVRQDAAPTSTASARQDAGAPSKDRARAGAPQSTGSLRAQAQAQALSSGIRAGRPQTTGSLRNQVAEVRRERRDLSWQDDSDLLPKSSRDERPKNDASIRSGSYPKQSGSAGSFTPVPWALTELYSDSRGAEAGKRGDSRSADGGKRTPDFAGSPVPSGRVGLFQVPAKPRSVPQLKLKEEERQPQQLERREQREQLEQPEQLERPFQPRKVQSPPPPPQQTFQQQEEPPPQQPKQQLEQQVQQPEEAQDADGGTSRVADFLAVGGGALVALLLFL